MSLGSDDRHADVAVIVPALNEGPLVGSVVKQLRVHFDRVIVVDDGSTDDTAAAARQAGAHVVSHPTNLGQGAAIQTGFACGLADRANRWFLTFDSDGQHRVDDAVRLAALARRTGVDVVLGSRFLGDGTAHIPLLRRLVLRAATRFTRWTTGLPLTDTHNGLRVLNRRAAEAMDLTLSDMAHASQLLSLVAHHRLSYQEAPVTVDYVRHPGRRGQSGWNALNIAFDLAVERLRGRR